MACAYTQKSHVERKIRFTSDFMHNTLYGWYVCPLLNSECVLIFHPYARLLLKTFQSFITRHDMWLRYIYIDGPRREAGACALLHRWRTAAESGYMTGIMIEKMAIVSKEVLKVTDDHLSANRLAAEAKAINNECRRRNTFHIWGGATIYFCYCPCARRVHNPVAAYYNERTIKYWGGYSPQSPPVPTPTRRRWYMGTGTIMSEWQRKALEVASTLKATLSKEVHAQIFTNHLSIYNRSLLQSNVNFTSLPRNI